MRRSLARNGVWGTIKLAFLNLTLLATGGSQDHRYVHDASFDLEYGVDTGGVVELDEMENPAGSLENAGRYEAIDPAWFDNLFARTGIENVEDFQLLDVGSGKGRVLMLGALAGFRDVIGVEIDEGLHRIASRNMEIFQKQMPDVRFTLHHTDLRDFAFPLGSILCFANNPVHQPLFQQLVTKIEEALFAHPRKFIFVYLHALHVEAFANENWVELDAGLVDGSDRHPYAIYEWTGNVPSA
ncbi:MAG: class I SAM-dependent methyltransferase [Pseudomonadota bacterium]